MTAPSQPTQCAPAADPHWLSRAAFPVVTVCFYLAQLGIGVAVFHDNFWLAVPLVLVCAHFMHGTLIGFHEASHGMLRRNRRINDIEGLLIGTFSFMSFTLYRVAHQTHHAHLGGPRDAELWPFVDTTAPRWLRVTAAILELFCGLLVTPAIFLRAFLREGTTIRNARVRRRIWCELAAIAVFWTLAISATAAFGLWKYFLWNFLLPGWIAGNLQSWRKYVEHVGLTAATIRGGTRSIVDRGPGGRLVAFTLLHEPFHGVHHQNAGMPHAELPAHSAALDPVDAGDLPPFRSYRHALVHLLGCLRDPRVGAQWHAAANAEIVA